LEDVAPAAVEQPIDLIFTDQPYNVPIDRHAAASTAQKSDVVVWGRGEPRDAILKLLHRHRMKS